MDKILSKECRVIDYSTDKLVVDFSGYGISVKPNKPYKIGDKVSIDYVGEISKPSFKVIGFTTKLKPVKPQRNVKENKSNE